MIVVFAQQSEAQAIRHLAIHSKVDQYELVLNGCSATVNGSPADLTTFREQLPVLTNALAAQCPAPNGPPDVTVKENGHTRSIYIKQGLVSDGKNCLNVSGDGLLYFPIHRDFLIGSKHDSITVTSPLKIFRQGVKLFELKKTTDTWNAEGTDMLLNWDFLERFQNSLKSFDVRFRAQPDLAAGKPKMIVQTGDRSYEFYKITSVVWAVKKPGENLQRK